MKTKWMILVVMLVFALGMMAQTATQAAPAAPKTGDKCPMMKDGKMADGKSCCGDKCCTGDKCNMAAHNGQKTSENQACCSGENGCCKDGKCEMAAHKDGKASCCGDKCPMMKKGDKTAAKSSGKDAGCCEKTAELSCCRGGAGCCKGGYMPCCGRDKTAA